MSKYSDKKQKLIEKYIHLLETERMDVLLSKLIDESFEWGTNIDTFDPNYFEDFEN